MSDINKFVSDISKLCSNKETNIHTPKLINKDLIYVKRALSESNVSANGSEHSKFESKIKQYTKSNNVVLVSNGSIALKLSLELLEIKRNSEVLLPSFNYISAANAVIHHAAIPHFIEINNNFLIDTDKLEKYLKKISVIKNKKCINIKTGRHIQSIICLHNYGHICDMEKIKKISKQYNFKLIEDAAEALGSFYKRKHAGTFGDIGILSFNGNKVLTTGGGGALLISNKKITIKAKKIINHNKISHSWKFIYEKSGYNFRLPNINAALGLGQIFRIREIIKQKKNLYLMYKKKLEKHKRIGYLLSEQKYQNINFWLQVFVLKNKKNKEKIIKKLQSKKIFCRDTWTPLHKLSFMKKFPKMNMQVTNMLHDKSFNLPSGLDIYLRSKKK